MIWYMFMLFAIMLTAIYKDKQIKIVGKKKYIVNLSVLLSGSILLFFAANRAYSVGADTRQQQVIFRLCSEETWLSLISSNAYEGWFKLENIEIGYKYYCKLLSLLGSNPQIITIANSIMLIIPLCLLVQKESSNKWLSIYLFFTMGFYQTSLNLTPSAIASLIAMNGFRYIREKNFIKYFLCILFASVFHYSAFLFLILYFVKNFKITRHRFLAYMVLSFVGVVFLYDYMVEFLALIVPENYVSYLYSKVSVEQLLVYLVQFVAVFMCMCWQRKNIDFYKKYRFELVLFLLESILYFLTLQSKGFSRMAFLFSPYLIISIPNMMDDGNVKEKNRAFKVGQKEVIMVLYGFLIYIARSAVNNIGTTVPYKFFY